MLKNKNPIQLLVEQQRALSPIKNMTYQQQTLRVSNENRKGIYNISDQQKKILAETRHKEFVEKHGNSMLVVRSPGNDLIEYYDEQSSLINLYSVNVPVSEVYKYRYNSYKTEKERLDYLKQLASKYNITDRVQMFNLGKHAYKWLVDKPSKQYEFSSPKECKEFMRKRFNRSAYKTPTLEQKSIMHWKGPMAGWSITWHD